MPQAGPFTGATTGADAGGTLEQERARKRNPLRELTEASHHPKIGDRSRGDSVNGTAAERGGDRNERNDACA